MYIHFILFNMFKKFLSVLTKTRNDLTILNHLKQHRNYLKPPKTSHITTIFFYVKINYSQVGFALILYPKVRKWVNLVSKTEVLQIDWNLVTGTLLHPYFEFNVYFSKIFVIHIFLGNVVPNSEVLQINWNLVQGCISIYLLRF